MVSTDVIAIVQNFYEQCIFGKSFNATFVSMIPNKVGAKELKNYTSIRLVRSVYKIISEVCFFFFEEVELLNERLKKVVARLVDAQQMNFIKGLQ